MKGMEAATMNETELRALALAELAKIIDETTDPEWALRAIEVALRLPGRIDAEQLMVQLAGCLTAAEGNIAEPAKEGDYGWSLAYQRTLELRRRYDKAQLAARGMRDHATRIRGVSPEVANDFARYAALADPEGLSTTSGRGEPGQAGAKAARARRHKAAEEAQAVPNDLVRLAAERAVRSFGDKGDGLFNAAGFSAELCKLARLRGPIDGELVRVILAGRTDIAPQKGGSHYQLLWPENPGESSSADSLLIRDEDCVDRIMAEHRAAVAALRKLCSEHLADIIGKHLGKHLHGRGDGLTDLALSRLGEWTGTLNNQQQPVADVVAALTTHLLRNGDGQLSHLFALTAEMLVEVARCKYDLPNALVHQARVAQGLEPDRVDVAKVELNREQWKRLVAVLEYMTGLEPGPTSELEAQLLELVRDDSQVPEGWS
jgi:hypothetical protein